MEWLHCISEVVIRDTKASTSTNILMTPHAPLEILKNSFSYRGPFMWNALPESIRKCATLNNFKKALRAHVFSKPKFNLVLL